MNKIIKCLKNPWPPRKNIYLEVYDIRLKREIWNGLLHIFVGIVITYTFIMPLPAVYALINLPLGFIRERWQWWRGKIQPRYIQIIDVITIVAGGFLTYLIVSIFNIDLDKI